MNIFHGMKTIEKNFIQYIKNNYIEKKKKKINLLEMLKNQKNWKEIDINMYQQVKKN